MLTQVDKKSITRILPLFIHLTRMGGAPSLNTRQIRSFMETAIPLRRRLLYLILAVLGGCMFIELSAGAFERWGMVHLRSMPTAAPGRVNPLSNTFAQQLRDERQRLGMAPQHSVKVSLSQDGRQTWRLGKELDPTVEKIYQPNSMRLRGAEPPPVKAGEERLVALGDSSVFGFGVTEEEWFLSLAAQKLSKALNKKVHALNAAIPGHTVDQSRTILEDEGKRLAPTWLIIGNLWSDIYQEDKHLQSMEKRPISEGQKLLRRLATYRVMHRLLSPFLASQRVQFIADRGDIGQVGEHASTRTSLPKYLAELRTLVRMGKELGARSLILTLPAPMDLDKVPVPETVMEFRAAQRRVAEETGSLYVDGRQVFLDQKVPVTYFMDQVHPAQEGHAVLGEAVGEALISGKWVP